MAQQGTRNWRTTCGRLRRFYVFANGIAQGGADTDAQLAALLARVAARKPGVPLTLREYGPRGERSERAVADGATAAAA